MKTKLWAYMFGETNPRWNGGNSDYPNHAEMKRMRRIKLALTNNKCEMCGNEAKIVHHIDGSKDNHKIENLQALCFKCHCKTFNKPKTYKKLKQPSLRTLKIDIIKRAITKNLSDEELDNVVTILYKTRTRKEWDDLFGERMLLFP